MSIEGISNYEHARYEYVRPAWERLERFEYCEQPASISKEDLLGKLKVFILSLL